MDQTEFLSNLTLVSSISILIPFVSAIIRYRQMDHTQRLLVLTILASLITEIIANYLWFQGRNNITFYNIYAFVNFIILIEIYRYNSTNLRKTGLRYLQLFIILSAVINASFFQSLKVFNSNIITPGAFVMVVLALNYFFKLLKEIRYQKLEKNPLFWINTGVLLYFSGTLILFLLSGIFDDKELAQEIALAAWGLNSSFNIILNILYTAAIWVRRTR